MINNSYCKEFSSRLYNIKNIVVEIMNFVTINFPSISTSDFYDLKLVFSELLINAVIHGNNSDDSKFVRLDIEILNNDTISATIVDEGLGFDYMKLSQSIDNNDVIMAENGRGICLVNSLTDYVTFNNQGNTIKFIKRVKGFG